MTGSFLKEFIGITQADEEALREVGELISKAVGLDILVEKVYERLLSYPETAAFFEGQDVEVRKQTLGAYLARLFEGRLDEALAIEHVEVGRKHQELEIPFEFLAATYGWVRGLVPGLVAEALPGHSKRAAALVSAFNKALDYDLCLLARGYRRSAIPVASGQ